MDACEAKQGGYSVSQEVGEEKSQSRQKGQLSFLVQKEIDWAIIFQSRSQAIWDIEVAKNPGAAKMRRLLDATDCRCTNPMCTQDCMQTMLHDVAQGSFDTAKNYLEALAIADCETVDDYRIFHTAAVMLTQE